MLLQAARCGHLEVAQRAVQLGASPLTTNSVGDTLLHLACAHRRYAVLSWASSAQLLRDAAELPQALRLHTQENAAGAWPLEIAAAAAGGARAARLLLHDENGEPLLHRYAKACGGDDALRRRMVSMAVRAAKAASAAGDGAPSPLAAMVRTLLCGRRFAAAMRSVRACRGAAALAQLVGSESWDWRPAEAARTPAQLASLHAELRAAAADADAGVVGWLLEAWAAPIEPPPGYDAAAAGDGLPAGASAADCAAAGGALLRSMAGALDDGLAELPCMEGLVTRWWDGSSGGLADAAERLTAALEGDNGLGDVGVSGVPPQLRELLLRLRDGAADAAARLRVVELLGAAARRRGVEAVPPRADLLVVTCRVRMLDWMVRVGHLDLAAPLQPAAAAAAAAAAAGGGDGGSDRPAATAASPGTVRLMEGLGQTAPWLLELPSATCGEALLLLAVATDAVPAAAWLAERVPAAAGAIAGGGRSALHVAASRGRLASVRWLVERGSGGSGDGGGDEDMARVLSHEGLAPAHEALCGGRAGVFRYLLERGLGTLPDAAGRDWLWYGELAVAAGCAALEADVREERGRRALQEELPALILRGAPLGALQAAAAGVRGERVHPGWPLEQPAALTVLAAVAHGRVDFLRWMMGGGAELVPGLLHTADSLLPAARLRAALPQVAPPPAAAAVEALLDEDEAAQAAYRACCARAGAFNALLVAGAAGEGDVERLEALAAEQRAALEAVAADFREPLRYLDLSITADPLAPLLPGLEPGGIGGARRRRQLPVLMHGLDCLSFSAAAGHLHLLRWLVPRHLAAAEAEAAGGGGALALGVLRCALRCPLRFGECGASTAAARGAVARELFAVAAAGGADFNAAGPPREPPGEADEPLAHAAFDLLKPTEEDLQSSLHLLRWILAQPQVRPRPLPWRAGITCWHAGRAAECWDERVLG
jgi:ankyrin repeat protein